MATPVQNGPWTLDWVTSVDPQKNAMPHPQDGPWTRDWNTDEVKSYPEIDGPWTKNWTNPEPENLRNAAHTLGNQWEAGKEMLKQTVGGTIELFGERFGDTDWGEYLREAGSEMRKEAILAEQKYPSPISFTRDVIEPLRQGNWEDTRLEDWMVSTLGRVAPMMAAGGVGAAAGAVVGATRGGLPGAGIGAATGAGLAMYPINVGEIHNEIKAHDETPGDGRQHAYALGAGAFNTFLDVASFGIAFKPTLRGLVALMSKDAAKDTVKQMIMRRFNKSKEFAEAVIVAATAEGATEATQEAAIITAVNRATGHKFDVDAVKERLIDAGAAGLFVGGVTGGTSSVASQFIAPNAKAQIAINETAHVDDPRRSGGVPGAIRQTPLDWGTDSINTVIEGFKLPMFTPGKYLGETAIPLIGRSGQEWLKNTFNSIGGKSAHRYLHYAGTSPAWAQLISRISPQENNPYALPPGYHEGVLHLQGEMQQELGDIFRKLIAAREDRIMSDEDNVSLMNAIEDVRGIGITYRVWETGARENAKIKDNFKDYKTQEKARERMEERKGGKFARRNRNLEVIIPKNMKLRFVDAKKYSPEIAEAAMDIRRLNDKAFLMAQASGIDVSYKEGYMPVHYNTKSAAMLKIAMKMLPNLASQRKNHEAGLLNPKQRDAFIALLMNTDGMEWRKHPSTGKSIEEGQEGWEDAEWQGMDEKTAQGVYDTITKNRLFIGERPKIVAKTLKKDENGNVILDKMGDPELNDYEMTRYEKQLANLGIKNDDIHVDKKTAYQSATKRIKGGGSKTNLHARRHQNMELSRSLSEIIPLEKLMPFRETSPHALMTKYLTMAAKRIEFSKRFGARGEVFNALMRQADKDWKANQNKKGTEIYAPKDEVARTEAIEHMYNVFDAIQGNYGDRASLFGDSSGAVKFQGFLYTTSYIRTLPLATLSSLAEPMSILMRVGPKPFFSAAGKTMVSSAKDTGIFLNKLTGYKASKYKINDSEIRRAAERMALVADWAVLERLTETVELAEGSISQKVTARWFRMNFNDQWTKLTRMWAFEAGRQEIIDNIKRLQNIDINSKTKSRIEEELAALGINTKEADQWFSDTMGDRAKEHEYLRKIDFAASRMTHEVIMSPNPANRPLWMSKPSMHLFAQLKGFQITFFNTVVQQVIKSVLPHKQTIARYTDDGIFIDSTRTDFFTEKNARIAIMMFAMLGIASFADTLKNFVKFGQGDNPYRKDIYGPDADLLAYWRYVFWKIAFMGPMQFAIDAKDAHKYGGEPLFTFAGPNVGWINEMMRMSSTTVDHIWAGEKFPRSHISRASKLLPTPLAGLPAIRNLAIDTFIPDGWYEPKKTSLWSTD